jgi:hypothetical protein
MMKLLAAEAASLLITKAVVLSEKLLRMPTT